MDIKPEETIEEDKWHRPHLCKAFFTSDARSQRVRELKLCWLCLSQNHTSDICQLWLCFKCNIVIIQPFVLHQRPSSSRKLPQEYYHNKIKALPILTRLIHFLYMGAEWVIFPIRDNSERFLDSQGICNLRPSCKKVHFRRLVKLWPVCLCISLNFQMFSSKFELIHDEFE